MPIYDNYFEIFSIDKVLPMIIFSIGICSNSYVNSLTMFCFILFLNIQSGQRFDSNSANDGSTNKLETNGYTTQQQMYTSTNNQGKSIE